jgi:carbon storage regulator CsrA
MLVLARKVDESIVIGDNIKIKVVSVDKGIVKLGIDAPMEVAILRSELIEDVKEANINASSHSASIQDIKSLQEMFKRK